jgi:hypothetical protein
VDANDDFPRSRLLRTVGEHPVAIAAALAAIALIGPATIGRFGLAGLKTAARNAPAMAPLIGQIARARLHR